MKRSHTPAAKNEIAAIAATEARIRARAESAMDIVQACLDRITRLNPTLNAFVTVMSELAIADARAADAEAEAGRWRGPLHGIPVAAKDFYDTAGTRTTAAFEHFKDRVPQRDADGIAKLKRAGAIIIGKTNMHRLGMGTTGLDSFYGPVQNPRNPAYIPGGSSSGSAAAVAVGLCYATLDTDAIGSCRLPAACCGVVGFKGTYGLIDPTGILAGEQDPGEMIRWFSHPAITTRSVEDVALMLDVLAERRGDGTTSYFDGLRESREVRIGVADNPKGDRLVLRAFQQACEAIARLGFPIRSATVPYYSPTAGLSHIQADRKAIADELFRDVDVVLLPTLTTSVPTVSSARDNPEALSAENTIFANYYGLPAVTVPSGVDQHGLPVGLQIVGKPWDEAAVLHVAHRFEQRQ